jgi:DNA-binding NtrC family response regulator
MQMAKDNLFRSDLYYRLDVFPIMLPPLRERREDIEPLVMHFVDVLASRMGKRIERIPEKTLAAFKSHSWPGNVRELQNLIERAVILSNDGVLPNPLPLKASELTSAVPGYTTLRDSEHSLILQTLETVDWVIGGARGAAERLGLKRTTLIAKMKKLGISRPVREINRATEPMEFHSFAVDDIPWQSVVRTNSKSNFRRASHDPSGARFELKKKVFRKKPEALFISG